MARVRLVHWNEAEAAERGERLRTAGYEVEHEVPSPSSLRDLFSDLPDAFLIDLTRMPAQGRDIAVLLRKREATRPVPIVFVGGESGKVERTRQVIPDAAYTSWDEIEGDLEAAIASPPASPVVPDSAFAGYSGTPLVKKLRIGPGTSVALLHAPDDFAETLDFVGPEDSDLIICFARSLRDLEAGVGLVANVLRPGASVWMVWPKKASGVVTGVTQNDVRALGLAAGLVDYKICSIDRTWSGLLFTRRKT